jgi:integrase
VIRALGRAWVEPDGSGGWRRRRGRVLGGALTETQAAVRMLELVRDHDAEQTRLEVDAEERRRRGVTFRELAAEWMEYLEHEKGAKPSTLRDYRWLLAEPDQAHRRGSGRSPGLLMSAFGDLPAKAITTRDVAEYLRRLDKAGATPRTVNKHRQVISAIYGYAMREDTYRLALNPAAATTKRREPPPAVLDFYETEEVEAIARAAEAGAHREVTRLTYDDAELAARAREDLHDGELYRIAAYTGLRLGELLALRWADVNLVDRRLVVHRAFSDRIEGPTKGWQARFLPIADPAAEAFARLAERGEFLGPRDYVFCSRFGRSLDGSALRRRFKRAAAAAGLRVLRFHALRHGAGSMIARQADPRWVQGFLGHSKLTTTERYLHAKARPQDVDILNRAFAAGSQLPVGTLQEWDRVVNEHLLPNTDPNRTALAGTGGRPATRDELIEFVRENNAPTARGRPGP